MMLLRFQNGMLALAVLLFISGCSFAPDFLDKDFRHLKDARERWEAYEIDTYSIDQRISCFCFPPYSFRITVKDNEIIDIQVDPSEAEGWDISEEQLEEYGLQVARTIDEVFDWIDAEREGAAHFEAEYDEKYGFPTSVYVDQDEQIADEELGISMSNLTF